MICFLLIKYRYMNFPFTNYLLDTNRTPTCTFVFTFPSRLLTILKGWMQIYFCEALGSLILVKFLSLNHFKKKNSLMLCIMAIWTKKPVNNVLFIFVQDLALYTMYPVLSFTISYVLGLYVL